MELRVLLAIAVLVLLVRVARVSWRHRRLSVAIWRAVRWHHLIGGAVLLVVVGSTALALVAFVPGADLGLGRLIGTSVNVVFTPLEEGLALAGPPSATGPDWALIVGASGFLAPLALLLPWLAFIEEELFRAGLETASWPEVAPASLVFGAVHLLVLVPIGAAAAIGMAGFAYALAYRRAHREGRADRVPVVALRTYRPTRRSRTAAQAYRRTAVDTPGAVDADTSPELAQATGIFAAAVWHTTFNTMVVVVLWVSLVMSAFGR
ncbi:MAG: hypothetical protein WEB03_02760 [Nitriliruptor sp.]|uniref:hypothetical protein n=1 Tax=Nitriliruptor sp. TaxID=2448056 RepID=UPI00349FE131